VAGSAVNILTYVPLPYVRNIAKRSKNTTNNVTPRFHSRCGVVYPSPYPLTTPSGLRPGYADLLFDNLYSKLLCISPLLTSHSPFPPLIRTMQSDLELRRIDKWSELSTISPRACTAPPTELRRPRAWTSAPYDASKWQTPPADNMCYQLVDGVRGMQGRAV